MSTSVPSTGIATLMIVLMIVYTKGGVSWPPSMATAGFHANRSPVRASGDADNPFSSFAHGSTSFDCDHCDGTGLFGGDDCYMCGAASARRRAAPPPAPRRRWHRPPPDTPEWLGLQPDLLVDILSQLPGHELLRLRRFSVNTRQCATRALERALKMSPEQTVAFCDAVTGKNVFLSGGAGKLLNLEPCPTACTAHHLEAGRFGRTLNFIFTTSVVLPCVTGVGKSYTLKRVIQHLRPESYTVTSSTGCSAAIIGATTLHSALGLGLGTQPVMAYVKKITKDNPFCYERIRRMRTLIIDEVSMLGGKFFDKAGTVVAHVRRNYTGDLLANAAPSLAWDGMQLILCGDFMQLPVVHVRENGWIFEAKCWAELAFKNHLLTMIHRQNDDGPFAQILARMRMGRSTAEDLQYLTSNSAPETPEGALQLFAVNAPADQINQTKMRELVIQGGERPHKFTAIDAGPEHLLTHCPALKELWLCKKARIICLKNIDLGIANGSLGTVQDIVPVYAPGITTVTGCRISVLFDGVMGGEPVPYTFSTYDPEVPNERVLKFSVRGAKDLEVASRTQIPLRLAYATELLSHPCVPIHRSRTFSTVYRWACSIHRSQGTNRSPRTHTPVPLCSLCVLSTRFVPPSRAGMSLDKVIIDFDRCFETGQCYTALSRVKTLAGCHVKNLTLARMHLVSRKALIFYQGLVTSQWV